LKITSLLDITGGTLLNTPAISFITQIHTKIQKINEGDLFISSNTNDIYEAVSKGAFCIITDIDMLISDFEIAWIKVDNLSKSAIKIIRFLLANKPLQAYYCDTISYELLDIYNPDKSKYLFLNNPLETMEQILNISEDSCIISNQKKFLQDIFPKAKEFKTKEFTITNLTIHSLFEVSFSISNKLFSRLRLPASYIYHFLSVKEFYSINNIDENKIKLFHAMNPIFINKSLQIVDFGKSNRFIICSDDRLKTQLNKLFIDNFYKYSKAEYIEVNKLDDFSVYKTIKVSNATCIYLMGCDDNYIQTILFKYSNQSKTLF
jgi:ferrochelatase